MSCRCSLRRASSLVMSEQSRALRFVNTSSASSGLVSRVSPRSITLRSDPRIKRYLHIEYNPYLCSKITFNSLCSTRRDRRDQKHPIFIKNIFCEDRDLVRVDRDWDINCIRIWAFRTNWTVVKVYLESAKLWSSSKAWVCAQSKSDCHLSSG